VKRGGRGRTRTNVGRRGDAYTANRQKEEGLIYFVGGTRNSDEEREIKTTEKKGQRGERELTGKAP